MTCSRACWRLVCTADLAASQVVTVVSANNMTIVPFPCGLVMFPRANPLGPANSQMPSVRAASHGGMGFVARNWKNRRKKGVQGAGRNKPAQFRHVSTRIARLPELGKLVPAYN